MNASTEWDRLMEPTPAPDPDAVALLARIDAGKEGDAWTERTLRELLFTLSKAEALDDLFIKASDPDNLSVYLNAGDLFVWACAEVPDFTPDDLPAYQQCVADLKAIGASTWKATQLFACRKEGMRPQGPWYGYKNRTYADEQVEALFDACGPERTDSPKIPQAVEQ